MLVHYWDICQGVSRPHLATLKVSTTLTAKQLMCPSVTKSPRTIKILSKNVAISRVNQESDFRRPEKSLPKYRPRLLLVSAQSISAGTCSVLHLQSSLRSRGELCHKSAGGHNGMAVLCQRHLIFSQRHRRKAQPGNQGIHTPADTGLEQYPSQHHKLPARVHSPAAHNIRLARISAHHRAHVPFNSHHLFLLRLWRRLVPLFSLRLLP